MNNVQRCRRNVDSTCCLKTPCESRARCSMSGTNRNNTQETARIWSRMLQCDTYRGVESGLHILETHHSTRSRGSRACRSKLPISSSVLHTHTHTHTHTHAQGCSHKSFTAVSVVLVFGRYLRPPIFRNLEINHGNGFSSTTSSFTAPLGGIYVFHLFYSADPGRHINLGIYVNGGMVCTGVGSGDYQTGTCSTIVQLKAGDVVNARRSHGPGRVHAPEYSTGFSGFLYLPL